MTDATPQETREFVNPLENVTVSNPFGSWERWKADWDEEMDRKIPKKPRMHALLGMLHFIYNVQGGYRPATLHLIEVADGFRWGHNLRGGEREGGSIYAFDRRECYYRRKDLSEKREIAQKAWRLLGDNFFADTSRRSETIYPSWAGFAMDAEFFKKFIWFFDPSRQPKNLPCPWRMDRYDELALAFLREFIPIAWRFETFTTFGPTDEDKALQQLIYGSRPKLMEILAAIQHLDFLFTEGILRKDIDQPKFLIDEASLAKLEELATGGGIKSLAEANWIGSYPARILLAVCAAMTEDARQERIAEARERAEEAARKLEEATREAPSLGTCPKCGSDDLVPEDDYRQCNACGWDEATDHRKVSAT